MTGEPWPVADGTGTGADASRQARMARALSRWARAAAAALWGHARTLNRAGRERERHATELADSEHRAWAILNTAHDAFVAMDASGAIIAWNPRAEAVFGWSAGEALGRTLADTIIPERYRAAHAEGLRRFLETGQAKVLGPVLELDALHRDGHELPVELTISSRRHGHEWRFNAFLRDISDRRRQEAFRAASQGATGALARAGSVAEALPELLRSLAESLGWQVATCWEVDPGAAVIRSDAVWSLPTVSVDELDAAMAGMALPHGEGLPGGVWESAQPRWIEDLDRDRTLSPAHRRAVAACGLRCAVGVPLLASGEVVGVFELFATEPRAADAETMERLTAIGGQVGEALRRRRVDDQLASAHAELERQAAELERRAAELERSNADLEQFAYIASHDLNEPLRVVGGFVQLLQRRYEGELDAKADEYVAAAVSGVERMQAMIDALLAYSRVGSAQLGAEPCDSGEAARAAIEGLEALIAERSARVRLGELPMVRGDPALLGQVFQNLVGNAVKFNPADHPCVDVSAERRNGSWTFTVADDGPGIEERFAARIFDMFKRLHGRDTPGLGIGLAMCRRIVERHGGRIWVEAQPHGGSAFRFTVGAS